MPAPPHPPLTFVFTHDPLEDGLERAAGPTGGGGVDDGNEAVALVIQPPEGVLTLMQVLPGVGGGRGLVLMRWGVVFFCGIFVNACSGQLNAVKNNRKFQGGRIKEIHRKIAENSREVG